MYMSRIRLRPEVKNYPGFWKKAGDEYQLHNFIWDVFSDSPERKRDYLYRREDVQGLPSFLAVSAREPRLSSGLWDVTPKEYDPVIREGQRLYFSLRANAVRTKRDKDGRQHRHDVVMEAKSRLKAEGIPKDEWPIEADIVQRAGYVWLAMRGESNGFSVKSGEIRADGYCQHRFLKPKGRNHVKYSTLDFTGVLTVTDPEAFRNALYVGLGAAKGFGCGLLMVRPVL